MRVTRGMPHLKDVKHRGAPTKHENFVARAVELSQQDL